MTAFGRIVPLVVVLAVFAARESVRADDAIVPPDVTDLHSRLEGIRREIDAARGDASRTATEIDRARGDRLAERARLADELLDREIALRAVRTRRSERTAEVERERAAADVARGHVTSALLSLQSLVERLELDRVERPDTEAESDLWDEVSAALADATSRGERHAVLPRLAAAAGALAERLHDAASRVRLERITLRVADGAATSVDLLTLGHVAAAYRTVADGRVGVALASPADASGFRWSEDIPDAAAGAWARAVDRLRGEGPGGGSIELPIDPTKSVGIDSVPTDASLIGIFRAGGPVMPLLLAIALIGAFMIVERCIVLYPRSRRERRLVRSALALRGEGRTADAMARLERGTGPVARVAAAALRASGDGAAAMEQAGRVQLLRETPRLERFLPGLAVVASVAPLLGLLGTVTGIIETFSVIQASGATKPQSMAGGISEALITTAAGLSIAIPVVLIRAALRGRVETLLDEAEWTARTVVRGGAPR